MSYTKRKQIVPIITIINEFTMQKPHGSGFYAYTL